MTDQVTEVADAVKQLTEHVMTLAKRVYMEHYPVEQPPSIYHLHPPAAVASKRSLLIMPRLSRMPSTPRIRL